MAMKYFYYSTYKYKYVYLKFVLTVSIKRTIPSGLQAHLSQFIFTISANFCNFCVIVIVCAVIWYF